MDFKAIVRKAFAGFKWFMENEQVEEEVKASKNAKELLVRVSPIILLKVFEKVTERVYVDADIHVEG